MVWRPLLPLLAVVAAGCIVLPCIGDTYVALRWEDDVVGRTPDLDWEGMEFPLWHSLPFSVEAIGWPAEGGALTSVEQDSVSIEGGGDNATHAVARWWAVEPPDPDRIRKFLKTATSADDERVEAWTDAMVEGRWQEGSDMTTWQHTVDIPVEHLELQAWWERDQPSEAYFLSDYRVVWMGPTDVRWMFVADRIPVPCEDAEVDLFGHGVVRAMGTSSIGKAGFRKQVQTCLDDVGLHVPRDARFERSCG